MDRRVRVWGVTRSLRVMGRFSRPSDPPRSKQTTTVDGEPRDPELRVRRCRGAKRRTDRARLYMQRSDASLPIHPPAAYPARRTAHGKPQSPTGTQVPFVQIFVRVLTVLRDVT